MLSGDRVVEWDTTIITIEGETQMWMAVASGKGGTGKTTIAVSLARLLSMDRNTQILDCDVEEPNVANLLGITPVAIQTVEIPLPVVDDSKCNYCGKCASTCRYNALAVLKDRVMVFPELCNGCGACMLVCPENAISERNRRMGTVSRGMSGSLELVEGKLDLGQAKAVPVIDAVKSQISAEIAILDSPPGSSCPVMETVRGCDLAILVSEPTRFGLHDLLTVISSLKVVGVPMVLVINKEGSGKEDLETAAKKEGVEVIARIPLERRMAEVYSRGGDLLDEVEGFREAMVSLKDAILNMPGGKDP